VVGKIGDFQPISRRISETVRYKAWSGKNSLKSTH